MGIVSVGDKTVTIKFDIPALANYLMQLGARDLEEQTIRDAIGSTSQPRYDEQLVQIILSMRDSGTLQSHMLRPN